MKVIVTGANGFIGSGLLNELVQNGCEVYAVLRSPSSDTQYISSTNNVHWVYCDMHDYDSLVSKLPHQKYHAFYHLAWEGTLGSQRADYDIQLNNCCNTLAAAKAALSLGCEKFICTGTITEFVAKQSVEKNYTSQNMVYAVSKLYTHNLLNIFCKTHGLTLVWAILSNTFGCGKPIGNIISYLIGNLIEEKELAFSSAEQPYDCVYLEDTVRALYLLAKCENKHDIYFIGSGKPRILKEYLLSAGNLIAPGKDIGIGRRADDNVEYQYVWFDTEALKQDTGFECSHTFEEGVALTADWYRAHNQRK